MRFVVNGTVTVSCWTEVEAESAEEAVEIAKERQLASLCDRSFADDADEAWHFESDGEPDVMEATRA